MGVDVPKCVRSRLKYSIPAALLTLVITVIVGLFLGQSSTGVVVTEYNPLALVMIVPVIVMLVIAIKTGDLIISTTIGSILAGVVACALGLMDFIQIDVANPTRDALFTVSGTGLDRTVGGAVQTGISAMTQMIVLVVMLFSAVHIMRVGEGDKKILSAISGACSTPVKAECTISFMSIILSAIMGLNAPAILTIGPSFARPLSKQHGISKYRMANLMDAQSCTWCYSLPWTCTMMVILGYTVGTDAPLSGIQIFPYCFFTFAMTAVMFFTIFAGIGRKDFMEKNG